MSVQKSVTYQPSLVAPGQCASTNVGISTVPPTRNGWVAGPDGVACGRFAWDAKGDGVLSNTGTGAPIGLVRLTQTGVITTFLGENVKGFMPGQACMPFVGGDFGAVLASNATASVKALDPVYADPATGNCVDSKFTGAIPTNFIFRKAASPGGQTIISGYYTPSSVEKAPASGGSASQQSSGGASNPSSGDTPTPPEQKTNVESSDDATAKKAKASPDTDAKKQ